MSWQMVAVLAVIAALVVFFAFAVMMARVYKNEAKTTATDDARNILENRYALGEIDDAEFAHRMQTLNEERRRSTEPHNEGVS